MLTLHEKVENMIGPVASILLMETAFREALANLVNGLPPDKAMRYATLKTGSTANGVIARGRIIGVTNNDEPCSMVPPQLGKRSESQNSIYQASPVFPSAWVYNGTVYGSPAGMLGVYVLAPPTVTKDTTAINSMPAGAEELCVLYAAWMVLRGRLRLQEVPIHTPLATPPAAPPDPLFTVNDAVADQVPAVEIPALPSLSGYTKPTHIPPTLPSISSISLPAPPAMNVAAPSLSYTDAASQEVSAVTLGNLPTLPAFTIPTETASMVSSLTEGNVGTAGDQTDLSKWFSTLGKLIENEEDPELANQAIGRINSFVQGSSVALNEAVSAYTRELETYRAEVQSIIQQAQLAIQKATQDASQATNVDLQNKINDFQAQVQNYQLELQRFEAQITQYSADVSRMVQTWQINELEGKINFYFRRYQQSLELFAADQSSEGQRFQGELAKHQLEVQRIIQQANMNLARLTSNAERSTSVAVQNESQRLAREVQEYQALLGRYQAELATYRADAERELNEFQLKMTRYKEIREKDALEAEQYRQQYYEKFNLMVMTDDGAANDRTGS